MKKFISFFAMLVIISVNQGKAQSWAPDGAEWHYEYVNFWYMGYIHINVIGDTVINDTACQVLEKSSVIRNLILDTTAYWHIGKEFMYSDNDRVYLYANNKFYMLYDFSAVPGDSWIIPKNDDLPEICNDEGAVMVTDTATVMINGQQLRQIIVEPVEESHWSLYGAITETIGPFDSYMLPEPDWYCVADLFEGGRLRCYSDPDFGLYTTEISPECDYLVSLPEQEDIKVDIYPNPCEDLLNINLSNDNLQHTLCIYGSSGKEVITSMLPLRKNQIDVSDLDPGIYAIVIRNENKYYSRKIIRK